MQRVYTWKLFLTQKRGIPVSWEWTRPYPKISEDVRRLTKTPENFGRRSELIQNAEHDLVPTVLPSSIRNLRNVPSFTRFTWTYLFLHWFEFPFFWKVCQLGCNSTRFQPGVRKDRSFQTTGACTFAVTFYEVLK